MRIQRLALTCFALAALVTVAAPAQTPLFPTAVDAIRDRPRDFVGRIVRLRGEVTDVRAIPLTEIRLVDVYDRTGTLLVITSDAFAVTDPFRGGVRIVGINTEGGPEAGAAATDAIADFLVAQGLVEREGAGRAAGRVEAFLARVLPAVDSAFFGIAVP